MRNREKLILAAILVVAILAIIYGVSHQKTAPPATATGYETEFNDGYVAYFSPLQPHDLVCEGQWTWVVTANYPDQEHIGLMNVFTHEVQTRPYGSFNMDNTKIHAKGTPGWIEQYCNVF